MKGDLITKIYVDKELVPRCRARRIVRLLLPDIVVI